MKISYLTNIFSRYMFFFKRTTKKEETMKYELEIIYINDFSTDASYLNF